MLGPAGTELSAEFVIPGTRMSTTSKVIAMAKMASLKNSTRSYSRCPDRASKLSLGTAGLGSCHCCTVSLSRHPVPRRGRVWPGWSARVGRMRLLGNGQFRGRMLQRG